MIDINLPTITIRDYQQSAWKAFHAGKRRIAAIWPRRAGKDTISLQMMCCYLHEHVCNGWHLMPEATQVRKAMWNGINAEGKRVLDVAFPEELRKLTRDGEMFIEFKNGSTIQFGGSDRYDSLVGSNPKIVCFSEYAISNPKAYSFVRPILAENGGVALFPFTPRGRNHGYDLYNRLKDDPGSFAEILTCDDTKHMSEEALALERKEMSEELFLQEYYSSFDFGADGAIYARYMNKADVEGRITDVPYDRGSVVYVSLDLGKGDATAIWYYQVGKGGQLKFIDYDEDSGLEVLDYVKMIKAKPYSYHDEIFTPHDGAHKRLGMVRTIAEQFTDLGLPARTLPVEKSLAPGIERCRVAIGSAVFDRTKTEQGRAALSGYVYEIDDKREVRKLSPLHNWASDGADAFRYAIQAHDLGYTRGNQWGKLDYSAQDKLYA